jgi:hypothetical protein
LLSWGDKYIEFTLNFTKGRIVIEQERKTIAILILKSLPDGDFSTFVALTGLNLSATIEK